MGVLHGMARAAQIVERELNVRIVKGLLENLPVLLEAGNPQRFGFLHYTADGPLKDIVFYRALDSHEETDLPLCTGATGFLRKPDI
ncbi:hypothetical protein MGALJ_58900 [Mycobacterium gallinarum]|uniref:Uncharacterized protein n=1 Tax=Mycobacterium gallinarum TaxID=39689 RepID=A0A9W4FIJ7_9MYCO|nr:hypothetical protein MGALJ_58900 [Mycobacterium gallinarum]